jgi:hypothetical protein
VGTLVAASLNPLVVAIVNDQFPLRRLQPPGIAGYEAVVQLGDGTRRYGAGPPAPYGTLAESVPAPDLVSFPARSASTLASLPPSGSRDGRMGGARLPWAPPNR